MSAVFSVSKISIIGCGGIGKSLANSIFHQASKIYTSKDGELHLVDAYHASAHTLAANLKRSQSLLFSRLSLRVTCRDNGIDFHSIDGSDIIIITVGCLLKRSSHRENVVKKTAKMIKQIAENIRLYAPNALVIVVTNPLDQMTFLVAHILGSSQKVIGMTCINEHRLNYMLYEYIPQVVEVTHGYTKNVTVENIVAMRSKVIGPHSERMIIDWDAIYYDGIPVSVNVDLQENIQKRMIQYGKMLSQLKRHNDDILTGNSIFSMMISLVKGKWVTACVDLGILDPRYKKCYLGFPIRIGFDNMIYVNHKYWDKVSSELAQKMHESVEFTKKENQKLLEMLEKEKISTSVS